MEVAADIVDKALDDSMDGVYTEDMVVEGMCKAWVALLEMNKVAVVDMEEIQLMELTMVCLEKEGEFEAAASYLNVDVVEEQHLKELDLVNIHLEH